MTTPDPTTLAAVENQQYARELRKRLPAEAAKISIENLARRRAAHEAWEKRFGEVVRGWRQDRNWSQEEVAERLRGEGFEMHQTTVAKIERGARPLRVAEASAIGAVFGMPAMAVFELSLPLDAPWWSLDGDTAPLREKQELLEKARELAARARNQLDAAAKDHAYFLAEIEKLVLTMSAEAAKETASDAEA